MSTPWRPSIETDSTHVPCKDCGKPALKDGYRPRCGECRNTNARRNCSTPGCEGRVYKYEGVWNTICAECYKSVKQKKAEAKKAKDSAKADTKPVKDYGFRKKNMKPGCEGCGGKVYMYDGMWNKLCSKCYNESKAARKARQN